MKTPRARTNKTRFLILGLLSEGPLSGYEIRRLTQLRFHFFWSESYGQLYPELARLEADGLITRVDTPSTGRQRNVFRISKAGTKALRGWLAEPVEPETARYEILLKVYFSGFGESADLRRHLTEFRERYRRGLEELNQVREQLRHAPDPHHNHDRVLLSVDFGVRTFEAWVAWADELLEAGSRGARR
jgi:DNA-binding PadR family transcriptional regulator